VTVALLLHPPPRFRIGVEGLAIVGLKLDELLCDATHWADVLLLVARPTESRRRRDVSFSVYSRSDLNLRAAICVSID
jgi:hypothetical protein